MSTSTSNLIGLGMPSGQALAIGNTVTTFAGVGTTQTGAKALTTNVCLLTTSGGATAFVIDTKWSIGETVTVFNTSATAALVFPPSGCAIDGGSTNASVSIAQNEGKNFMRVSSTSWRSGGEVVDAVSLAVSGNATIGGTLGVTGATTLSSTLASGTTTITSTSASALTVGANGATNPVLQVDANTASVATGLKVTGAAAAGGIAIAAISSGTDESVTIDAKGSGTLTLNGTATGNIVLGRAATGVSLSTSANITAGGYFARSVGNALTAAGTDRATALQLAKEINNVTTAAASTGVVLPVGVIGMRITVFNGGANALQVYASASETIDGVAGATGVPLTNAKRADFFFTAANTWISAQLGVVSA